MRTAASVAGLCVLAASISAIAFERSDGTVVRCEVTRNAETREIREVWLGHGDPGDRHPELGGAAAVVRTGTDGWPVIYFDSVVFKAMTERDPHMSDFVFYHECAHAKYETHDEIEANCIAYLELERQGLLTHDRQQALGETHKKMRRLPSRYGGSGAVFWERTLSCVNDRLRPAGTR